MLRRVDIRYRTVLLPVSEVGATINYVLGATNYRTHGEGPASRRGIPDPDARDDALISRTAPGAWW
jgi:hypothetical protein